VVRKVRRWSGGSMVGGVAVEIAKSISPVTVYSASD